MDFIGPASDYRRGGPLREPGCTRRVCPLCRTDHVTKTPAPQHGPRLPHQSARLSPGQSANVDSTTHALITVLQNGPRPHVAAALNFQVNPQLLARKYPGKFRAAGTALYEIAVRFRGLRRTRDGSFGKASTDLWPCWRRTEGSTAWSKRWMRG